MGFDLQSHITENGQVDQYSGMGLANRLKYETWDLHKQAERTGLIRSLLRGTAHLSAYYGFLRNLYEVYLTLEAQIPDRLEQLRLSGIWSNDLYRSRKLASDIAGLSDKVWDVAHGPHAKTLAYCNHLEQLSLITPLGLLGHIYVRYLGDLNGGAILGRQVSLAFGLGDAELGFYSFAGIPDVPTYRERFRETLNDIELAPEELELVVNEARLAFEFMISLSTLCEERRV